VIEIYEDGRMDQVVGPAGEQLVTYQYDEEGNPIRIETALFKQMINQVSFAAATDDTRPVLTGVSTKFDGDLITMAATDGFRLSIRNAKLPSSVERPFQVIVPARALESPL